MAYQDVVMTDAPLAYWRLGETAGTQATDSSGYARHATYTGGPTLNQAGGVWRDTDRSVGFDGVDDRVQFAGLPTTAVTSVTMECWAYIASFPAKGTFVKLGEATGYGVGVGSNDMDTAGYYLLGIYEGIRWIQSYAPLHIGWNHIVAMVDPGGASSGGMEFYHDGTRITLAGTGPASSAPTGSTWIGGYVNGASNRFFGGRVDEVAIYGGVLSAARIKAHYEAGAPYTRAVLADSPVSYYRLDESVTGLFEFRDRSTNSYHANFSSAVTRSQPGATLSEGGASALFSSAANSVVSVNHNTQHQLVGDLTLEAWVYPLDRASYYMIVTKANGTAGVINTFELRLDVTTGQPSFLQVTGSGLLGVLGTAPPLNTWSHLAVTKSGTTVTHYLNGLASGTGTISNVGVTTGTDPVRIGARQDGYCFNGRLDRVALYNTALSADRIAAHYAAASSPLQRWTGSVWTPATARRWDGSAWVPATVTRY